jgi:hypothetical protein
MLRKKIFQMKKPGTEIISRNAEPGSQLPMENENSGALEPEQT